MVCLIWKKCYNCVKVENLWEDIWGRDLNIPNYLLNCQIIRCFLTQEVVNFLNSHRQFSIQETFYSL